MVHQNLDLSADPLGHRLLFQRMEQIPGELAGMLVRGLPQLRPATLASERFIVTGTGSSEAHARYFCTLINHCTDRAAAYIPLSHFVGQDLRLFSDRTLVVFSQGISPNAQIALARCAEFRHTVVFTATTPNGARVSGKSERADLICDIVERGGDVVYFPLSEEYTTLLRIVGPLCGYLACLQFVSQLAGASIEKPKPEDILPLLDSAPPQSLLSGLLSSADRYAGGFQMLAAAPISDYSQNLACKFMEGLFWACPSVSDFLQFAHGPLQQMAARPRPVLVLHGGSRAEDELVERSRRVLDGLRIECHVLSIPASPLYSIFGFEAAFNRMILRAISQYGIDQVNWPGKGRDDALYGFCRDLHGGADGSD